MRWAEGALAMLVMAGCAANPRADGAAVGAFVHVVVENERAYPDFLRIVLVPASGPDVVLGVTSTLGTDTLVARGPLQPGRYSLRAEIGRRDRSTGSPTVYLRGGETLYWNLRDHTVRQTP
ncbi:MAG TPA: hypothetical protein VHG08_26325 [Longimicrobium sp.]|nr:hypothetical protein [Longimicrobium sp.]